MKGYVYVDPPGIRVDEDLKAWVQCCVGHVSSLPAKQPKKPKQPKSPKSPK